MIENKVDQSQLITGCEISCDCNRITNNNQLIISSSTYTHPIIGTQDDSLETLCTETRGRALKMNPRSNDVAFVFGLLILDLLMYIILYITT